MIDIPLFTIVWYITDIPCNSGSERHKIKVLNMDGLFLSSFDPLTLPRQQNRAGAPISSTAFHPHRMMLACASMGDTHVTLFECRTNKKGLDGGDRDGYGA